MSVVPPCLRSAFADVSDAATEIDFPTLLRKVEAAVQPWPASVPDADRAAVLAEFFALGVYSRTIATKTSWGLFFGPSSSMDGRDFPSRADVSREFIEYWAIRSAEAGSPALVARYADVAWEFRRDVKGTRLSVDVVHRAIDARLRCASGLDSASVRVDHAERALQLAVSIHDAPRATAAAAALLTLADGMAGPMPMLVNRVLLDLLDFEGKAEIAWDRADRLADELSRSVDRLAEPIPPVPNGVQILANASVVWRYLGRRRGADAARAFVDRVAGNLATAVPRLPPQTAAHWLEDAITLCREAGVGDRARELTVQLEAANRASAADMQTFTTTIEITREQKEKFVSEVLEGGLLPALARWLHFFLPTKERALAELKEQVKESPLLHMIQTKIMDDKHARAQVGGVLDDMEGQLLLWLRDYMHFSAPYMRIAIEAIVRRFEISGRHFVGLMANSPACDPTHAAILGTGFEHYLRGDFLSALHLLTPQVEHLLRGILRSRAETQSVRREGEVYEEMVLGGLLQHETVVAALGADIVWYLQGLLDDERCWNLRNRVAHGLLADRECGRAPCERVIHALLLIVAHTLPETPTEQSSTKMA